MANEERVPRKLYHHVSMRGKAIIVLYDEDTELWGVRIHPGRGPDYELLLETADMKEAEDLFIDQVAALKQL